VCSEAFLCDVRSPHYNRFDLVWVVHHLLVFSAKLHSKPRSDRVSSVLKSAGHPSGRSMPTDN
ncbi:hypothetical protein, partial [Microcoleus sp. Pol17_C1]|uniref:hypothetical protein n=1 Tax=Microcoleus sp. Pol17_C1 TaxID=2818881 RepID=UPI002FD709C2